MKTKNMRKKALLSSVAMLLVAVVALSGATYAWFTANSAANVYGMKLTTSKDSTLLFSNDPEPAEGEAVWTPYYDFGMTADGASYPTTAVPVSTIDGRTFYKVNANPEALGGTDVKQTKIDSIVGATANTDYISKTVYVKSGAAGNLKITGVTASGLSTDIRVSVSYTSGGTTVTKIYSESNAYKGNQKGLKATCATPTYAVGESTETIRFNDLYTGTAAYVADYVGTQAVVDYVDSNENIVALAADTPVQLTINVWLEGNNDACTNALAGKTMNDLTLVFSVA